MTDKKPISLIDNARAWWKLWTIRLSLFGAAFMGILTAFPDIMLQVWLAMPDDLKALLPQQYVSAIALFILVGTAIVRVIKQQKLDQSKTEEK